MKFLEFSENRYSENLEVFMTRKGLYIFDVDFERWVYWTHKKGYKFNDIAEWAKQKIDVGFDNDLYDPYFEENSEKL